MNIDTRYKYDKTFRSTIKLRGVFKGGLSFTPDNREGI